MQPEGEAETRGTLPEEMFNSESVDFSAGEKFFEDKLSWPSPTPEDTIFHSVGPGGLVVHCGRARQVAARGARHFANRS